MFCSLVNIVYHFIHWFGDFRYFNFAFPNHQNRHSLGVRIVFALAMTFISVDMLLIYWIKFILCRVIFVPWYPVVLENAYVIAHPLFAHVIFLIFYYWFYYNSLFLSFNDFLVIVEMPMHLGLYMHPDVITDSPWMSSFKIIDNFI